MEMVHHHPCQCTASGRGEKTLVRAARGAATRGRCIASQTCTRVVALLYNMLRGD